MLHTDVSHIQQRDLLHLQSATFTVLAPLIAGAGYLWLTLLVWPNLSRPVSPLAAWMGGAALSGGVALAYGLRARWPQLALQVFVWSILSAVGCALWAFGLPELAYLCTLPVIFASVLLGGATVLLVAGAAGTLILMGGYIYPLTTPVVTAIVLPIMVVSLVAIAAWLASRNLYMTLDWAWVNYERARAGEQIAAERQADLRRTVKALDEATYRLDRMNTLLSIASAQADEARRLKQQFAQTISHELRTPLNLIVGFTDLMIQSPEYYGKPLTPAYQRDIGIVHRNARHLLDLVNDVLDLARIEAAQMSLVLEYIDPATLVRDAVATVRGLVESRGLALQTIVEPDLPSIRIDPVRIRQVLFNLLSNAARFTSTGTIMVQVQRDGDALTFAVADTGVGMAAASLTHIFDEFQQVDGTTRRGQGGTGLGLAISQRFVELHNGRIWAESQLGVGSTFSFQLPINHPDPITAAVQQSESSYPAFDVTEGRTLLMVTRSPAAAHLLARYIHDCTTLVAPDLEHARQIAAQRVPQVVLLDQHEPASTADLHALACSWNLPHTPFIACALPGEETLRQRLEVDAYLIKPFSRTMLWDVLRPFGETIDTILVIDDDPDFVRLLSRMLDNPVRRYQVFSASSGAEGLELLRYHQPDLVLLDLMLPDLRGDQVVAHMRAQPHSQHTPVVIISAQDEIDPLGTILPGGFTLAWPGGMLPGQAVQLVQCVLDAVVQPQPVGSRQSAVSSRQ